MIEDIIKWIEDFVEKPNKNFSNFPPCPFSKRTRKLNRVKFIEYNNDENSLKDHIDQMDTDKHDMTIIICDKNTWTAKEAYKLGRKLDKYAMKQGLAFHEDHPKMIEKVGDTILNNSKYILLYIQSYQQIKESQKQLRKTKYYDIWKNNNIFGIDKVNDIDCRQDAYNDKYG
tara:strand:- start:2433 stop:2948 length:516 start_codon:yes stop_codon:yes gene_type:complete